MNSFLAQKERERNELSKAEKLNQKGLVCLKEGKVEEAIKWITMAIEEDPTQFDFYGNRCSCYVKQKKFVSAIKDIQQSLKIQLDNP